MRRPYMATALPPREESVRELWNIVDTCLRLVATVAAGALPRRYWSRLDTVMPVSRAALPSAIGAMLLAALIAIPAFIRYAEGSASTAVDLMLQATGWRTTGPSEVPSEAVAVGTWSVSYLSWLNFLLTPLGLLSMYLAVTGYVRAVSAYVGDARGDPVLTMVDMIGHRVRTRAEARRTRRTRHQREGPEVPDRLLPGAIAGFPDADYVVVASRRKPEWQTGAFVITRDKWYRLGTPVEREMPAGLRTLYPLTEMGDHEVLRRGIRYELPAMSSTVSKSG